MLKGVVLKLAKAKTWKADVFPISSKSMLSAGRFFECNNGKSKSADPYRKDEKHQNPGPTMLPTYFSHKKSVQFNLK